MTSVPILSYEVIDPKEEEREEPGGLGEQEENVNERKVNSEKGEEE